MQLAGTRAGGREQITSTYYALLIFADDEDLGM
jgi:hypothetical protein